MHRLPEAIGLSISMSIKKRINLRTLGPKQFVSSERFDRQCFPTRVSIVSIDLRVAMHLYDLSVEWCAKRIVSA
jgi:hypothetical protein